MFWFVFLIALFWGQWGGWGQLNCLFIDSTKTFKVPPFILHCLVCASITLYFYCIALCRYICRVRIALFMAPRTTGFHMCWQLNNCLWFLIIIIIIITKQVTKLNTSLIIAILTFINTVSHYIDLCHSFVDPQSSEQSLSVVSHHTDHPHYHGWLPLKSIMVATIWFLYHAPPLTIAHLTTRLVKHCSSSECSKCMCAVQCNAVRRSVICSTYAMHAAVQ